MATKIVRKIPKLRKSAKGEDCTLRIYPYCNEDPEKTMLCHISTPETSGMGLKAPDWMAVYGCSDCHDVLDSRVHLHSGGADIDFGNIAIDALFRTWQRMIEKGLIKI